MDGKSFTPQEIKLQQLKEILPEAFAEGKIDWEKLKATLGEDINFANERYVLNWAGKSEAFRVLQAPTTKTLVPDKEESVNFDETEHIFIEGENLEVLKVLQKSYFGKVKMIYIDPPYNTGNDSFIYPDKFSETKAEYQKRVGDKDEEGYLTKDSIKFPSFGGVDAVGERGGSTSFGGVSDRTRWSKNSKENGQYHSNWLNMMYPRLFLAKNLLRQDGVIFISIDDNEVHNLRLMMNEVFGEENFVAELIWQKGAGTQNDNKYIANNHEYILCYSKLKDETFFYNLPPSKEMLKNYNLDDEFVLERGKHTLRNLNDFSIGDRPGLHYDIECPDGTILKGKEHRWRCDINRFNWRIKNKRIVFEKNKDGNWQVFYKQYLFEKKEEVIKDNQGNILSYGRIPNTLLVNTVFTGDGKKEIKELFGKIKPFDYPKPTKLINQLATITTKNQDLILDFFAGSGTTAHAVMQLNAEDGGKRKCISVQLPELTTEKSEAYKAGYKTIADIAKERIRRAGKKIREKITSTIKAKEKEIEELNGELNFEEKQQKIENLKTEIEQLKKQDLGFKVFKLSSSNFKRWQQIQNNSIEQLEQQMLDFTDPVSENATIENMLYELLLKSGKDLNSKIEKKFPSSGGVDAEGGRGGSTSSVIISKRRAGRNSKNYFSLPYNPKLEERARKLRKSGNLSEVLLWQQVRNKQFKEYDFDRQKIIGNYIVDFYCTNCNVVIEVDGASHNEKQGYDAKRDAYLESLGLTMIHIDDKDIKQNLNGVMEMLENHPAFSMENIPPCQTSSATYIETKYNTSESNIPPRQTSSATPPEEGNYYCVNDNELILMLEKASQEIVDAVIAEKPQKVIALDRLFKDNDQLKTNTSLQMKDAEIEFKTI